MSHSCWHGGLVFRPGEAFQFDWSEDHAVPGGERPKLQVAHIKLSHSRAFLERDEEKWLPVFLETHATTRNPERDEEKWLPVFLETHATTRNPERDAV